MEPVEFQLDCIFTIVQRTETTEKKRNYKGRLSFHFLEGEWQILSVTLRRRKKFN